MWLVQRNLRQVQIKAGVNLHLNVCMVGAISQSVSGTLDRPRVVAPRLAVMCDPPGVVGVEPSVVLDLLHPSAVKKFRKWLQFTLHFFYFFRYSEKKNFYAISAL